MKNSCVQWVAKELAIVLPYLSDSDLQYNLRQGWRHAVSGYCDHCSWTKLNNWSQCRSSLRCCNQSVHVYQNCLEQSQKHVCDGAYDHYNYMETRLKGAIELWNEQRQFQLTTRPIPIPTRSNVWKTRVEAEVDAPASFTLVQWNISAVIIFLRNARESIKS